MSPYQRVFEPVESNTRNPFYGPIASCSACGLHEFCRGPVPPVGPSNVAVMFVGEAPGATEDQHGIPLTGATWEEMRAHLHAIGLSRDTVWLTNLIKCKPEDDPQLSDAAVCAPLWLEQEIKTLHPKIVVAMGQLAIRYLLGDSTITVEESHGYHYWDAARGVWIVPAYHPASGFYQKINGAYCREDFQSVRRLLDGKVTPPPVDDRAGKEEYVDARGWNDRQVADLAWLIRDSGWVAIDTETTPDRSLWCFSLSMNPGEGYVLGPAQMEGLLPTLNSGDVDTIWHNANYDIPRLREAGYDIRPPMHRLHDTLVMARLLQLPSAGLKSLMRRELGMEHKEYRDIVGPAQIGLWREYLTMAVVVAKTPTFPNPKPFRDLNWDKGEGKLVEKAHKPQPLWKKLDKALGAMTVDADIDMWKRWRDWGEGETAPLVKLIGPPQTAHLGHVDPELAVWYSARDADGTGRLYPRLRQQIIDADLLEVYETIDMAALPMILDMIVGGIPADRGYLEALMREIQSRKALLELQSWQAVGTTFSLASSDQRAYILFDKLRFPVAKRTKGGKPSVDDSLLIPLKSRHPIVPLLLDWMKLDKLEDAYIRPLIAAIQADSCIHPEFSNQTVTGRLADRLLTLPSHSDEGRQVTSGFTAPPGWSFIACDYSQVELRILAHESQDPVMIEVYGDPKSDLHKRTAGRAWGIPESSVTKEMRDRGKTTNFSWAYWISPKGLYDRFRGFGILDVSLEDCERFLHTADTEYAGVVRYRRRQVQVSRRTGAVVDMWGRRRLIPEIQSSNKYTAAEGERVSVNHPIQAGAQGIIKKAMGTLYVEREQGIASGRGFWQHTRPILQVHDALDWLVRDECVAEASAVIQTRMENVVELLVPLVVDVKIGKRMGELE